MKSMTIGKKISLTCAVLVVFSIISNGAALLGISRMTDRLKAIVSDSFPGVCISSKLLDYGKSQREAMLSHVAWDQKGEKAAFERDIADFDSKIKQTLKEYEKTITSARGRELYEKIGPADDRVSQLWPKVAELSRAGKTEQAMAIWKADVLPAAKARAAAVRDLLEFNRTNGDGYGDAAAKTASSSWWLGWTLMLISLASGSVMAFFSVRGVNRILHRTVTALSEGSEQIASASAQVASSSQTLAQGASEQAASLEETSASSEEITSMTRKNAENSQSAATVMAEVDQRVTDGNRTLEEMLVSMHEITSSSDKISKIIKVIDEIAFQTNILALNAAVEAARAGEAGMGFAVVADEVRNLAQRSAQAAKDTAALIEESIAKSNEGSGKLQRVTEVIHAITVSAAKVKTLVDEVNLGSQEQARGMDQISRAIAQMDQVTQSNAASAEESASASEEMSAQAEALNQIVNELRTLVGAESGAGHGKASKAPAHTGRGLVALKTAVSAAARRPVKAIAPAAGKAIPLDDDFVEM